MKHAPDAMDRAAVRIFPPAAPLLTIVAGLALQRVVPIASGLRVGSSVRALGIGLIVASVALLGAWPVALVRRSGQSENPWKPTTHLLTDGPFRVTRNPMYLQMVLVCIGSSLALGNAWILLLTPLCAAVLQRYAIRPEEQYLERKFGADYRAYRSRVRRWI